MKRLFLPKVTRLCSESAIEALFNRSSRHAQNKKRGTFISFPIRAVWIEENFRHDDYPGTRFLISVPKKKLRRAVDRVKMRRRIREAWRLNRPAIGPNLDVALIYMSDKIESYESVRNSIFKILSKLPCRPLSDEKVSTQVGHSSSEVLSIEHLSNASGELPIHPHL